MKRAAFIVAVLSSFAALATIPRSAPAGMSFAAQFAASVVSVQPSSTPVVTAPTVAQADLLRSIASQVGFDGAIVIGSPPLDFHADPNLGFNGTSWIYLHSTVTDTSPYTYIDTRWRADLVAGIYRSRAARLRIDSVLGTTETVTNPDGVDPMPSQGVLGPQPSSTSPPWTTNLLGAQIGSKLDDVQAATHAITNASLTYLHVDGLIPILSVRASDPDLLAGYLRRNSPFPRTDALEIKVLDSGGRARWMATRNYLTGAGQGYGG